MTFALSKSKQSLQLNLLQEQCWRRAATTAAGGLNLVRLVLADVVGLGVRGL